jgi:hypothetical protein
MRMEALWLSVASLIALGLTGALSRPASAAPS